MPDDIRAAEIERKIDREVAGALALTGTPGAMTVIAPRNIGELMEFAKLMAVSGPCVRAAFRGNPGACLALSLQAFKCGADPFAFANKAYIVKNKAGEEQIAYEAQLVHSIVNASGILQTRLRPVYSGSGQTRKCTIYGLLKREQEALEYESPEIGKISVKNSPLWQSDPDQQLFYYSTRAWARRHVPEILLGIYTVEEIRGEIIEGEAREIPPRPRREDFVDRDGATEAEDKRPFVVADSTGEFRGFTDPTEAHQAMVADMRSRATARGEDGVEASWNANAPLVYALREAGRGDLAEQIHAARMEIDEELRQVRTPAPEPAGEEDERADFWKGEKLFVAMARGKSGAPDWRRTAMEILYWVNDAQSAAEIRKLLADSQITLNGLKLGNEQLAREVTLAAEARIAEMAPAESRSA